MNPDKDFKTGLLGRDLQGSLSPSLHNEGFRAAGVSGHYQPIDFTERGLADDELSDILEQLVKQGFAGVNVTHPFKTKILPLLDEISDDAARLGAVNTVVIRDGRTAGHNTDWMGFRAQLASLKKSADPVLVMGAGGAGRAVLYALQQAETGPVLLFDPDPAQATATLEHFADPNMSLVSDIKSAAGQAGLLINASPVGMHGKGGLPLAADLVRPNHRIAEVVYFPVETAFVKLAKERGCDLATGDIMCLHQAIAAFDLMTGLAADATAMTRHFDKLLAAAINTAS